MSTLAHLRLVAFWLLNIATIVMVLCIIFVAIPNYSRAQSAWDREAKRSKEVNRMIAEFYREEAEGRARLREFQEKRRDFEATQELDRLFPVRPTSSHQ